LRKLRGKQNGTQMKRPKPGVMRKKRKNVYEKKEARPPLKPALLNSKPTI